MGAKKKHAGSSSASKTGYGALPPPPPPPPGGEARTESKSGDTANEIDQIFSRGKAQAKRKLKDQQNLKEGEAAAAATSAPAKKKSKAHKTQKREEEGAPSSSPPPSKPRRKTNEGFSVYTAEELGWNQKSAGGTALCPFDCDCCF